MGAQPDSRLPRCWSPVPEAPSSACGPGTPPPVSSYKPPAQPLLRRAGIWVPGGGASPCYPQDGTPRSAPARFPPQLHPATAALSSAEPVTAGGWRHQLMFGYEAAASGQPGCRALGPADPADLTGTAGGVPSCPARGSHWIAGQKDSLGMGGHAHFWP